MECNVSPPSRRAAAFDGANFFTAPGPIKKVVSASVTFNTVVFPDPPGLIIAKPKLPAYPKNQFIA